MRISDLILTLVCVNAYFEQRIIRRAFTYDPDLQPIDIDKFGFPECPKELLELKHNETYVTQICFTKDLFYNVEVMLGKKTTLELSLDLTSPWTWFKSKHCKLCRTFDWNDQTCKVRKTNCDNDQFDTTYDSPDWQDDARSASIYSEEDFIKGKFQSDKVHFLAYNSTQWLSLGEYVAEKLGKKEKLDPVTVDNLRMLSVQQMYGAHNYLADGVLGLGFGFAETDDDDAEPDTDFLEKLIKEQTSLKLTRQRFAIYCLEIGAYFPDFVVQFGGFDVKYAHEHSSDIKWLKRIPNSGYYWMVELNAISFQVHRLIEILQQLNHATNLHLVNVTGSKAIITLSSQFIELPLDELKYFIDTMNSFEKDTQCSLVDQEDLVVYCKNLHFPIHFIDLKVFLHFGESRMDLSSHLLYQNCTANPSNANLQDCLLNVRYSRSGLVILGEPFMKWHYTIFDNEPGSNIQQIGLLPAATNMYYLEHPGPVFDPRNWSLYKLVIYIFVFGIVLICCAANCRRLLKDLYRAWQYRKDPTDDETKRFRHRVKQLDDELNQDGNIEDQINEQVKQQEARKQADWDKNNKQFNFQMKFDEGVKGTQSIEDSSI